MSTKTQCLLGLFALAVIDALILIPIVAIVLAYVILVRPPWFLRTVRDIYGE